MKRALIAVLALLAVSVGAVPTNYTYRWCSLGTTPWDGNADATWQEFTGQDLKNATITYLGTGNGYQYNGIAATCRTDASGVVKTATGTIAVWFYLDGTPTNTLVFLFGEDGSGQNAGDCALWVNSPALTVQLNQQAAGGAPPDRVVVTTNAVTTGAWHHVIAEWANGNHMALYIDGVFNASNLNGLAFGCSNPAAPVSVGVASAGARVIPGKVDDVIVYYSLLSDADRGYVFSNRNFAASEAPTVQILSPAGPASWWSAVK